MEFPKRIIIWGIILFTVLCLSFRHEDPEKSALTVLKDSSNNYMDGTYEGHSQAQYTSEYFWGDIRITVNNSLFTDVRFKIRDTLAHENVDSMYGVIHYEGYPLYMQQCVNEQHGIEVYPGYLLNSQDLDNVDAYTGASAVWSHDIFIASAKEALKDAKKPNRISDRLQTDNINICIWPNPFSTILSIEYTLSQPGNVNLCIYNSEGKLVKQFVNKIQQIGYHSYRWDDCSHPGIYFYCLCVNEVSMSSKIVKLNNMIIRNCT